MSKPIELGLVAFFWSPNSESKLPRFPHESRFFSTLQPNSTKNNIMRNSINDCFEFSKKKFQFFPSIQKLKITL